ncbi:MAG TPA: septal ring lytic transglycosylase RlpA family protein [Candidatus Kapabacteria bacterium]
MTQTLTIPNNRLRATLSEISGSIQENASLRKERAGKLMRRMIAIGFLTVGSFLSMGTNANTAIAKKIKQVKSKLHSGEFRLLNIYNSMKASNPSYINRMNHARAGLASWYGGIFQHRKTAMGTTYNMYSMTAAHRSLPLGTWVKVTNETNGKSVTVQVTDRGPYVANRVMDLSYAAAQKLGYANAGTTHISMKVLGSDPDAVTSEDAIAQNTSMQNAAAESAVAIPSARSENMAEAQPARLSFFAKARRMMSKAPVAMIR